MEKIQLRVVIVVLLLLITGLSVSGKETSENELTITYVGSSGYLIETSTKKVMVDAVFDNFVKKFEVTIPSDETREKIGSGVAPFDSIDLFFVSHSHKGHFDFELLAKAIASNPEAHVITNQTVYEELQRTAPNFESFKERVYFPGLNIGEETSEVLKDIEVIMSKTDHWGDLDQLNFEFEVDGIKIVYALEPETYTNRKDVDVQFLNSFDSKVAPKYLILTHQSGNDTKKQKLDEARSIANASFFMESLEKLTLLVKDDKVLVNE